MKYMTVSGNRRHACGWRRDSPDHRDRFFRAPKTEHFPDHADLRALCPPVRDQLSWGSCTANACAEAMGFLYCKAGKEDPLFSRFFLYYFSRMADFYDVAEDSGASIRSAIKSTSLKGACREATWPYVETNFSTRPSEAAIQEALQNQTLFYYRCSGLQTIRASLVQGFPIVFGFSIPANLYTQECEATGILKFPAPDEELLGGHAVLACGFDDTTQRITFQNSWGSSWGDKGFGYLPYRFVIEDLASDFWTIRKVEMP